MSRSSKMLKKIKKKEAKRQAREQKLLMTGMKKQNWKQQADERRVGFKKEEGQSYLEFLKSGNLSTDSSNGLKVITLSPQPKVKFKRNKLPVKTKPLIMVETLEEKTKLTKD